MAGITEIKNRLPQEFVNNLYEMFTPGMVDNIFRGIAEKRLTTLRVNTLKYDIQSLMKYFKEINSLYGGISFYMKFLRFFYAKNIFIMKLLKKNFFAAKLIKYVLIFNFIDSGYSYFLLLHSY